MKKISSLLIATTLSVLSWGQSKSIPINEPLPEGEYHLLNVMEGNIEVRLDQLAEEKALLVIFTCNTCPFVIKNIERTRDILEYAQEQEINVALINSNEAQRDDADSQEKMMEFGTQQNYPNYIIDEGSMVADLFGASHTPEVFLFNKERILVYKGAMDDSPSDPKSAKKIYLKEAIKSLKNESDIKIKETKSIGCSIKRIKN